MVVETGVRYISRQRQAPGRLTPSGRPRFLRAASEAAAIVGTYVVHASHLPERHGVPWFR